MSNHSSDVGAIQPIEYSGLAAADQASLAPGAIRPIAEQDPSGTAAGWWGGAAPGRARHGPMSGGGGGPGAGPGGGRNRVGPWRRGRLRPPSRPSRPASSAAAAAATTAWGLVEADGGVRAGVWRRSCAKEKWAGECQQRPPARGPWAGGTSRAAAPSAARPPPVRSAPRSGCRLRARAAVGGCARGVWVQRARWLEGPLGLCPDGSVGTRVRARRLSRWRLPGPRVVAGAGSVPPRPPSLSPARAPPSGGARAPLARRSQGSACGRVALSFPSSPPVAPLPGGGLRGLYVPRSKPQVSTGVPGD